MMPVTIGTRVRTGLYNRGLGTVFAIHGEQAPKTIGSVCGIVRTGGRASFDIVFDQGSRSMQLPEAILHGVQWEILDEIVDEAAIATALARAEERETRQRSEKTDADARFAAEVDRLRNDETLVTLTQGDDTGSGKLAAKNIRTQLRRAFPGIKFSVRVSGQGAIDIEWTDGPTSSDVKAITEPYCAGHFDGMEDIYKSSVSPWDRVFGGAQYVFPRRNTSDGLIAKAIEAVFETYAGNFAGTGITATATDYRAGRLFAVSIPLLGDSLETAIREQASTLGADCQHLWACGPVGMWRCGPVGV